MKRHLRARLMEVAVRGCFAEGDGNSLLSGGDVKPPEGDAAAIAAAAALKTDTEFVSQYVSDPEVVKGLKPEVITGTASKFRAQLEAAKSGAVPMDDVKAYLTAKGTKPEDLAKMDEAALRKAHVEGLAKDKADASKPIVYDIKLPQGVTMDEAALKDFKEVIGPARVPQEVAQKLVDQFAARMQEAADAPYKLWQQQQAEFKKAVESDPEIGGAKLKENMGLVTNLIDQVGAKEAKAFRDMLDATGAGNHPEMARFMIRLARLASEGKMVMATKPGPSGEKKSAADIVYPDMGAKQP